MPGVVDPKAFTARVPKGLYEASRKVADRRGVSVNALIQEGLILVVKAEEKSLLYDAYTQLGEDQQTSDVEFAFAAQREVVLGKA